jgi:cyclic beta-1,2-glucan synthetase
VNDEARIDLIAQAWSVLSKVAPERMQTLALAAMQAHLVDVNAGLLRLLDPPLVSAVPSAGYIQAYPPGIRENGGQYSHGAVWGLMAQAAYATSHGGDASGVDKVYQYFTYLSPAHRTAHSEYGAVYGIEPYVIAGDVYTHAPYVGRGGWSWYTGAAAWLHRAALESIFGMRQSANTLTFTPCLPTHWPTAELVLARDGRTMRFIFVRDQDPAALQARAKWNARLLMPGASLNWATLERDTCFVIPLLSRTTQ